MNLFGLHRLIGDQGQAGNLVVVLMIMFLGEESRVDFEDAIEIEGILSHHHPGEVDSAALRPVDRRVRVDPADATFDRGKAVLIDKIDLVDENDIGERKLFPAPSGVRSNSRRCLASVTVTMASSLVLRRTSSSTKKVCGHRGRI